MFSIASGGRKVAGGDVSSAFEAASARTIPLAAE
jgi:hypothetical protein